MLNNRGLLGGIVTKLFVVVWKVYGGVMDTKEHDILISEFIKTGNEL